MGYCKSERSRRFLNVEIRVLGVAGFYRLLEDVDFVRVSNDQRRSELPIRKLLF